jgi:hypothetical protein
LQSARVLTVGESKDFLQLGGCIRLAIVDGRMRFEASLPALEQRGISVSSKLLRFGQVRRGKVEP